MSKGRIERERHWGSKVSRKGDAVGQVKRKGLQSCKTSGRASLWKGCVNLFFLL